MILPRLNSNKPKLIRLFLRQATAFFGVLLMTSLVFASENRCASIFADERHLDLSEAQLNNWSGYATEGLRTLEGQWFILPRGGHFPQRILFPDSLTAQQKHTVKQLEEMRFDVQLNEARIRSYWKNTGQDPQQPLPQTTEKWPVRQSVEVAAMRFIGKNGKTFEKLFTSKLFDLIKIEDFSQAFDELSQSLQISEVETIEFFHTHPPSYRFHQPLTEGDGQAAEAFTKSLTEKFGSDRPVFSMYSIHLTTDGDTVLFNSLH